MRDLLSIEVPKNEEQATSIGEEDQKVERGGARTEAEWQKETEFAAGSRVEW